MKPIYIAATLQDCGKTSVTLGLMQLLHDRGFDPGYCKPVGQHYVRYQDKNIDKDSVLMHQVFNMQDEPCLMSPIAIERDFTRKFINNPNAGPLEKEILHSRDELFKSHKIVLFEGTGHAGVGSCFGLSNARVAQLLNAKVVVVTAGGIGKPIDEIALSLSLFREHNVEVLGVILNKVLPEKYDMVKDVVSRGLKLFGTKLLGAIPYEHILSTYTVGQLAEEFKYNVLCGQDALSNPVEHTVVAAMEPQNVVRHIRDNTLVIMPGDRIDNILVSILVLSRQTTLGGGLILTGGFEPHPTIEPLLKSSNIPVLTSADDTFTVSARMKDLGFKIQTYDTAKIARLHQLVAEYADAYALIKILTE
jgi:BioD-like phosphotransacetylase family protein